MTENLYIPDDVRRELNRAFKREKYYRENVQPRLTNFSEELERTYSRQEDNVEYVFEQKMMVDALYKALADLPEEESEIIRECFFFDEKKPSNTVLSKKYGITPQAYGKKLRKILDKLKKAVEMHINSP